MTKRLLWLILAIIPVTVSSQNFWNETFTNGCTANCNANGYAGPNGGWTVSNNGINGADNNQFYISCAENGQAANVCGAGCGTDASLHIGSNGSVLGDNGAAYLAGGLGFWNVETAIRAESPLINCTGKTNISVCFNYIEWGDGTLDDASLWYFDGTTWSQLLNLPKTNCCGGVPCNGTQQGLWMPFTIALPASANNNANVRIGFNWVNNDDNVGTDPSFAVDDIVLSTLPGSSPIAGLAAVNCNDNGVTYSVTNNPGDAYSWTLSGGGTIAAGQGTSSITINWGATAGTYTITLTETSCSGVGTPVTLNVNVNCGAGLPPSANFTVNNDSICPSTCINFTDVSTGSPTSWSWTFPGGTPANSNVQSPAGICYNAPGTYTATLTATNANGSSTSTQTIVVNPLPVVNINPLNPTICNGDIVTLTATGATLYSWTPPTGLSATNISNPDASPVATTTYTVTGTLNGCSATASTTVNVAAAINGNVTAQPPVVCIGGSTQLQASGGTTYTWTANPTLSCTNCSNPVATPVTNTFYEVTVTSGSCAPDNVQILVTVANPPVAAVTSTQDSVCTGIPVILSASGGTNYQWSPSTGLSAVNTALVTAMPATSTTYMVIVSDANNCSDTAYTDLFVYPNAIASFSSTQASGCAPLCVDFTDSSNPNGSTITAWSWNFEGQPSSTTQNTQQCFNSNGLYDVSLTLTTADGCTSTSAINDYVNVNSTVNASFSHTPASSVYITGQDVQFNNNSTGATGYLWNFANGDSSVLTSPAHAFADTGMFCVILYAFDSSGCMDTASACLYFQSEFTLYYPNTFTPNEDEINPTFHLYGAGVKSVDLRIFDRWGEEICTINSMNGNWNGNRLNGTACPQGVYVCRIVAIDYSNNEYSYISHINLVR